MGVTVVGAGVVGLLSAWQLRREGHAVTLIAPEIARDASYAAAGMLAPISEVQYGQDRLYPLMTAARAEYPAFLATLAAAVDAPTGWRENGTILLAADRSDRDAVADLVAVQQAHGMAVEPLTSGQLRRREPALAPGISKGWDVPSDHQVDPRMLASCALAALESPLDPARFPDAGPPARRVEARVTAVGGPDAEGSHTPTLDDGTQRTAQKVLLVPGLGCADIAGLPARAPLDLRPVHGDVLRLRVRPGQLLAGEDHVLGATVRAKVAGRSVYLVPRADGGLVIGASSREDGMPGTHAGSVQELLDDAVAVLPAVKEMELEEITTRARPGTPDDIPYLGRLEGAPDVVISTGYSRHGILLAPLAARLAAALLSDDGEAALSAADRQMLAHMSPTRSLTAPEMTPTGL
ncbi:glycine oxidase ThiO [Nesterenkonia sp. HG001]|uniref:glycine oxidase ThiO n=1 Tax=Nesterenkonia sp. HG001 TaxID=2983207 RepID=UPI002AC7D101|nr:glycine oxidase ThiO [Nesterenkonia sp. HG001]MDZ5078309.1 glycine oxidase ThiO [Nesterenkonia sp. HG001]